MLSSPLPYYFKPAAVVGSVWILTLSNYIYAFTFWMLTSILISRSTCLFSKCFCVNNAATTATRASPAHWNAQWFSQSRPNSVWDNQWLGVSWRPCLVWANKAALAPLHFKVNCAVQLEELHSQVVSKPVRRTDALVWIRPLGGGNDGKQSDPSGNRSAARLPWAWYNNMLLVTFGGLAGWGGSAVYATSHMDNRITLTQGHLMRLPKETKQETPA